MYCGFLGSSANVFLSSETHRTRTSSVTNVSAQTVLISLSLGTTLPSSAFWARQTRTCMALGSRRTVRSPDDRRLSLGATNHSPNRKSPSTAPLLSTLPNDCTCILWQRLPSLPKKRADLTPRQNIGATLGGSSGHPQLRALGWACSFSIKLHPDRTTLDDSKLDLDDT